MPKWADNYMVTFVNTRAVGGNAVIARSANAYISYYKIPPVRCFTLETTYTRWGWTGPAGYVRNVMGRITGGTLLSRMGGNCLGLASIDDKLILVGHGGADSGISYIRGWDLASSLHNVGLRNVGLVAFKSCHLGRNNFLEEFGTALTNLGVNFGWLVGYRSSAATVSGTDQHGQVDNVHEYILGGPNAAPFIMAGNARVRTVRGNTPLTRPGLRDYAAYL